MRVLDGIQIIGPDDGDVAPRPTSALRTIISAADTEGRWSLGEVRAGPDKAVATPPPR